MPAKKKRARKKSGATRKTEPQRSVFSWIIMGVLLAGFVAFLVHLDQLPDQGETTQASVPDKVEKKQAKTNTKPQNKAKEHQFDFYTVLPDREVEVIKPQSAPPPKTTNKPKTVPAKVESQVGAVKKAQTAKPVSNKPANQLYQLQVGSFSELAKADAMKARLAFMGVESNIQVIRNNDKTLYRVRVGPSTDQKKLQQVKAQLKGQNINTFMKQL